MPIIPTPDEVYGWCTWRVLGRHADTTADADDKPDAIPVTAGAITISPRKRVDYIANPSATVVDEDTFAVVDPATGLMLLAQPGKPDTIDAGHAGDGGFWLAEGEYDVVAKTTPGGIDKFTVLVTGAHTKANPCDFAVQREQQAKNPVVTMVSLPVPLGAQDGNTLVYRGGRLVWAPTGTGGGGGDALIPVKVNTTPAAGTTAGQLIGYLNTGTTTITVAGADVPAGTYAVFFWDGTTWVLASGGGTPKMAAPIVVASDIKGTSATINYSGAEVAPTRWQYRLNGGTPIALDGTSPDTITGLTPGTDYTVEVAYGDATSWSNWGKATFSTPVVVTYRSAVLADAPDYYFPLDDAAGSASIRNLGALPITSTSFIGTGLTLGGPSLGDGATSLSGDGTAGSHIKAFTGTNYPAGKTAFTVEFIAVNSLPYSGTGSRSARIWNGVDDTMPTMFNTYQAVNAWSVNALLNSGWVRDVAAHWVITWDGATLIHYKNGTQVSSTPKAMTLVGHVGHMTIGGGTGDTTLKGNLAGLALYAKALPADRALAHAKAAGFAS